MILLQRFTQAENLENATQMARYMRNQFSFLGIRAPERKRIFREYMKEHNPTAIDWNFINQCWQEDAREYQYFAVDYLIKLKKHLTPAEIPMIKQLIETKSWWDTVDGLDELLGFLAYQQPGVEACMLEWSRDSNFWVRRVAINHQLLRKEKTNTALLEQIIGNNLEQSEFFINKAIGWSLRDYSKTNPDWVRQFIEKHHAQMASLSIREASKYL